MEHLTRHFDEQLVKRQINRRGFLKFCGLMAATLALEKSQIGYIITGDDHADLRTALA